MNSLPDYQSFMLPVLRIAGDVDGPHSPRPMSTKVADLLEISEDIRREMLPSGTQSTLLNRVNWAMYYLYRAGLLNRPTKRKYFVSEVGGEVLRTNIDRIDNAFLEQFESFKSFKNKTNSKNDDDSKPDQPTASVDPVERIEQTTSQLKNELTTELQDTLKQTDPSFFERVVITTSDFPQSAWDFVGNIDQKIILIDGIRLTELMIEHNIGVSIKQTIQIKAIDSDYFEEG